MPYTYLKPKQPHSQAKMLITCFFLGNFGIHRLCMGYRWWWLMFLTIGGFTLWTLIDLVRIGTGKMKMADGKELSTQ